MSMPEWVPEWPSLNFAAEPLTPGERLALGLLIVGVATAAIVWPRRARRGSGRAGR